MPDNTRRNHPGIGVLGHVTTRGTVTTVHGWTLRRCATNCDCHINATHADPVLLEGDNGSLGLRKYRPCNCCEPWMWHELAAYLQTLAYIEAMPTTEGHPS